MAQPQNLHDLRSSKSTVYQDNTHPFDIPKDARWTCHFCGVPHCFRSVSDARPLGRVKCPLCGAVMDSLLQITGFPSLETVHGTQLLSVPSESNGPPKTIFGTICCQCGRSHHRKTFEIIPRPPSPPPEPPDLSKTDKVRKKLMIGITRAKTADYTEMSRWQDPEGKFRDLMDEEEFKLTFGSYPLWGRKEQKKQERKLYKVSFNKACGCGNQDHFTCPQCLKFRVVAEGEWATEEQAPDRSALLRNG